ncbi:c-type cytochrome [Silvimonas soli]|uniref:c-type cytochrome n=1 Tax=Silvimonas soli TaxID=2980100 RepID=UPI0024B3B56A|nr:cytochrome c [Silvimonas soli]
MKLIKLPVIALCLAVLLAGCSHEDPNSPVYKRKQVFKEMLRTSQSMRDMLKGNATWNAQTFAANAAKLQQLSTQPWPYFVPVNKDDSSKTDAKPNIWEKPQDFHAAAQKLQDNTAKLQQLAATNDPAQIRPQFEAMEESCTACHKAFREF